MEKTKRFISSGESLFMKLITLYFLFFIYGLQCNEHHSELKVPLQINPRIKDSADIRKPDPVNYPNLKDHIRILKEQLASQTKNRFSDKERKLDSAKTLFVFLVVDSVIPYWEGTKWSFYGNTEQPQSGSIACGYFVTTVLRDAGTNINRIKLAQCASENMITALVSGKYIRRFRNTALSQFIKSIKEQGKGLYIVGLDNHTGFIVYDNEGIWFIHSSYVYPGAVARQDAATNAVLSQSKYRITGKISDDESFIFRWLYKK